MSIDDDSSADSGSSVAEDMQQQKPTRFRRWGFRAGAVGAAMVLTLAGLEIALRAVDLIAPMPMPRESMENAAHVDASRNAWGWRERWEAPPGDAAAVRIAFLGDSFAFGAGVEQEEGFVHLVEGILNGEGAFRYVTINLGEPGTDPTTQIDRYVTSRQRCRFDVLVHVLYCNDLGHDLYDELKRIHALADRRSLPAQYSHLWRFVESRLRYADLRRSTLDYFRGGDSPLQREETWAALLAAVRETQRLTQEQGTLYVVVLFPWLFELDDYPLEEVHRRMRTEVERMGIPFFDLLDAFREEDARAMRLSVIDEHPSPMGHRKAARAIARFLVERDLLVASTAR